MNSIHSIILRNVKRALALSLGVAAIGFLGYSFYSLRKTETQALRFITGHVTALAEAGINSQNVNEIDKEIARFAQTWKETQDLDLRVDILLDGRLVSHAGQLQPFGMFHTRVEEVTELPSGQRLIIKVEISLVSFILSGLVLLLCIVTFISGVFSVQMRMMRRSIQRVTNPLETQVSWLRAIAENLPESAHANGSPISQSGVREIEELSTSITVLLKQILLLEDTVASAALDSVRVQLAEEVAHSIKGVIATLQLKIENLASLAAKDRRDLVGCISALQDVSQNLLMAAKPKSNSVPEPRREPVHILPAVTTIMASKRSQYSNRNVRLEVTDAQPLFGAFCELSDGELQTVIATIVDNAFEATPNDGRVVVEGFRHEDLIELRIRDNGSGIPKEVLDQLLKERMTFGKPNGNGIGLVHAQSTLAKIGGSISIASTIGVGTTVTLRIPSSRPVNLFLDRVELPPAGDVVIIDDDSLVHSVWDQRLKDGNSDSMNVVHLNSVKAFEEWITANGHGNFGNRLYLFDCDLKDPAASGLDLIEKFGLTFESVLISGMAEEPDVRARTRRLGVRWLPKDYLGIVPMVLGGGA